MTRSRHAVASVSLAAVLALTAAAAAEDFKDSFDPSDIVAPGATDPGGTVIITDDKPLEARPQRSEADQKLIDRMVDYYLEMYGKHLESPDWVSRCMAVIGLFVLFAYRGFQVALNAPDTYGCLVATGATSLIAFQAAINIAVMTSSLPFTGITLPFISAGGSSLVVSLATVGILLNVSKQSESSEDIARASIDLRWRNRRARLSGPRRSERLAGER